MSESLQRLAPIARDATDVQLGCGAFSRRRVGQSVSWLSAYKRLSAKRVMHAEFGENFMLSSNSDRPSI